MKKRIQTLEIAAVLSIAALTFSSSASASCGKCAADKKEGASSCVTSTKPGVAGGVMSDTYTESATVTGLDKETRQVTLTGKNGAKTTFTAGPEVANFDQIKVGDVVKATVSEELAVSVRKPGKPSEDGAGAVVAAAPLGEKPGVVVAAGGTVTAKVKSINAKKREATLTFPDGTEKTVKVRKDVKLKNYAAGDEVVIRVTQALAISVEKP